MRGVPGIVQLARTTSSKRCPSCYLVSRASHSRQGQGSLLPAYPGGFEILAAARPHGIILQHAPARKEYDGFPGFPLHPLATQIQALELVSGKPVIAIAVNHENVPRERLDALCREISEESGLPVTDALIHGPGALVESILGLKKKL
jgi:uncharacterized NAD-dependent epimerase/dehydratase family protein